jgi:hypothetical protein
VDSGSKYSYRQVTSPAAHDPERNRHRSRVARNKFAVRAILINPRYTGYQVWNKQRKDEVLIDVEDVALGHTTKLPWNDNGTWLWSDKVVRAQQPPSPATSTASRAKLSWRARSPNATAS